MNEKALLDLGFPKEKVLRFLNHPYYTPREITYFRFYSKSSSMFRVFRFFSIRPFKLFQIFRRIRSFMKCR